MLRHRGRRSGGCRRRRGGRRKNKTPRREPAASGIRSSSQGDRAMPDEPEVIRRQIRETQSALAGAAPAPFRDKVTSALDDLAVWLGGTVLEESAAGPRRACHLV